MNKHVGGIHVCIYIYIFMYMWYPPYGPWFGEFEPWFFPHCYAFFALLIS